MTRTTFDEFYSDYLPKDGELGDQLVLGRSPTQLKHELDYYANLMDILISNPLGTWSEVYMYHVDDFVYYEGYNYIALRDNNNAQPDTNTDDWELVDISAVGGGAGGVDVERQDFIVDFQGRTDFVCNMELLHPSVFVEGVLMDEDSYTTRGTLLRFNEGLDDEALVSVYSSAAVPTSVLISDTIVATEGQTAFPTSFEFLHEAVYINGVLQHDNYAINDSLITFNSGLFAGDIVKIFSGVAIENYHYETEVDFDTGAGQTVFTIEYVVGKISVYRNGVKLRDTMYTADNGTDVTVPSAIETDWIQIVKKFG